MSNKQTVLFFPGKNTPLKRYVSYFKNLNLKIPEGMPTTTNLTNNLTQILCHSRGLDDAINFCTTHNVNPTIISMDGVQIEIPKGIKVISFRPEHKHNIGDESLYSQTIYYKTDDARKHHPYRDKRIRDKIERFIYLNGNES